jgi:Prokaryotic RING finger family 1
MAIHTCSCGAKVRLPDNAAGRTFRCPQCQIEIEVISAAGAFSFAGLSPSAPANDPPRPAAPAEARPEPGASTGVTCPICQTAVGEFEPAMRCPKCEQVHHRECWQEIGGCSTYGCEAAPNQAKETPAPQTPLSAWGDNKKCPACGETIKAIALRCRYCRTDFDTVDPLTAGDLRRKVRTTEETRGLRTTVIVLFCMALSGCLAPLALVGGLALILPQRKLLVKAGPFYHVLGYSTLGLASVYSILMGIFLIFS